MREVNMGKEEGATKTHILVIPQPVQGHMNPMLQFSKRLASRGLKITFVTTTFNSKTINALTSDSIKIETISDGSEEGKEVESLDASLKHFEISVSQSLNELIENLKGTDHPPKLLVYDSFMPWLLDIAQRNGLEGASFFTQSCAVCAIYYHVYQRTLKIPNEPNTSMPSMPQLGIYDFPSFVYDTVSYPGIRKLVSDQFSNFQKADWLLFNTFNELEEEAIASKGLPCYKYIVPKGERNNNMEKQEKAHPSHVLVTPFPAQGHINPMLEFSKRLAFKGLKVTLVTTMTEVKPILAQPGSVSIEAISCTFNQDTSKADGFDAYLKHFQSIMSKGLPDIILKHNTAGHQISCLVYDSTMPWALDIAKQLGLAGAPFFTQSCAVGAIYYNVRQGRLSNPKEGPNVSIAGLPVLDSCDLPSFVSDIQSYPSLVDLVLKQFLNHEKADWIFFNTFNQLEEEAVDWMASQWPIKTIGPTIPSMYLDKRLECDRDYGLNLFKPNVDDCMKWLDTKENGSVIYVSFGSLATLGQEQMEELALGLKRSGNYFLWVVRELEWEKLPSNFVDETLEKGLVVTWCPQLDILAHKATGCFVTHCGWNSTLEALSLGVPMVAMPQWTDQPTNGKFVADVWQVGVRVKVDDNGIVKQEEIELCIREVMEGERGNEIKRNAARWKELAKEAVDEGGSSDKNIEEFVTHLEHTYPK